MNQAICSKCGTPYLPAEKFCGKCGNKLEKIEPKNENLLEAGMNTMGAIQSACPKCGSPYGEKERFCGRCGTALTVEKGQPVREQPLSEALTQPLQATEVPTQARQDDRHVENVASPRNDTVVSQQNYTVMATQKTPALIIYLLDVSGSMSRKMGGKQKIEIVAEALSATIRQMVFRSTKGGRISPRYRIAIFAYSEEVYDLLGGVKTVDEVVQIKIPELSAQSSTRTAKAFAEAEKLLQREMPNLRDCPAPVICHMTDGEYSGTDPEPIAQRIMQMAVPDGNVLIENIFISEGIVKEAIKDVKVWEGIMPHTPLQNNYAKKLRAMSSPIPDSYREMMIENSYRLKEGSLMLLPGTNAELVTLGFQMSAATPVR